MTKVGEYGISANVFGPDKVLRTGAKVRIIGGWSGGGFERVRVIGAARNGRQVTKWAPLARLTNFRSQWVTEAQRELFDALLIGESEAMAAKAKQFEEYAAAQRTQQEQKL